MPVISVVIPTYNRAHLIKRAIDSVLSQTYQDFELIIVDDGSNDNTEDIVKNINDDRIRYIRHNKNKGSSAARNTGIENSKGEYIAFLDSDDVWLEKKLEKQMKVFSASGPEIGVIHCGIQYIDYETQKPLKQWIIKDNINEKVFNTFGAAPGTPTMLIRKSVLMDVGFFDESIPAHEETDLSIRLAQKYKYKLIDEFLVVSYSNHTQITSNLDSFIRGKEIIYEKHKNTLTKDLLYNLCNIIAGDSIFKGNYNKGKIYLLKALHHKPYKIKTIFSLILSFIAPKVNQLLYERRYKKFKKIS